MAFPLRTTQILVCAILCGAAKSEIRYAGELYQVPEGCRAVAMGGGGAALPGGAIVQFWNPSLIGLSDAIRGDIEGARLYDGLSKLGTVSFAAPVQDGLSAGILYTAFFPDDITEWDSLPGGYSELLYNPELRPDENSGKGVFHNNQHLLILSVGKSFAIPLPRPGGFSLPLPVDLAIGLNIKWHWMTMTPGDKVRLGMNFNLDFGFALRVGVDYDLEKDRPRREVLLGVALRSFLPSSMTWFYSHEHYEEPIDGVQEFGLCYVDRSGFLFANWVLTVSFERSYERTAHAGVEAEFFDMVAFRGGIDGETASLGAGIRYRNYSIDYAFCFDELSYSKLRLGAGVQF